MSSLATRVTASNECKSYAVHSYITTSKLSCHDNSFSHFVTKPYFSLASRHSTIFDMPHLSSQSVTFRLLVSISSFNLLTTLYQSVVVIYIYLSFLNPYSPIFPTLGNDNSLPFLYLLPFAIQQTNSSEIVSLWLQLYILSLPFRKLIH